MPPGYLRRIHVHTCMRGRICVTGAFKPHTRGRAHTHSFNDQLVARIDCPPGCLIGLRATALSSFAYQDLEGGLPAQWLRTPVLLLLVSSGPLHSLKTHTCLVVLFSPNRTSTAFTKDRHETRRRRHTTPRVRCEKTGIDEVARPAGRPRHLTVFKIRERHLAREVAG